MIKVGLFGIDLDTYWNQSDNLLNHLTLYQSEICENLNRFEVEAVDVGMVDNPMKAVCSMIRGLIASFTLTKYKKNNY